METIKDAWAGILECLRNMDDVSNAAFDTWLAYLQPRGIEDGKLLVSVHTDFQRSIIQDFYSLKIEEAIRRTLGLPLSLVILSDESDKSVSADDGAADTDSQTFPPKNADYEYSFENFVVGPSNQFAHAASQAVAKEPSSIYNPLFIHGGSGLGKTHLMCAICNEIKKRNPDFNIVYTKGENMTNEVIEAIRNGQTAELRAKYRQADMLLVDDIQFIAGKESTQTEFFHTFEALYQDHKQIVLTSDRPPKEIASLTDRLRGRFEAGLLADIQPPDYETRIAIVKRKATLLNLDISDDLAEYIAAQLKSNVRQLEGTVRRMYADLLLRGEKPSLAVAQTAIRDIQSNKRPAPITVEMIVSEVSRTMNVSVEDIYSKKHSAPISRARQVAMFIVREVVPSMSMEKIGKEFGGRDHSTVVYTMDKMASRMAKDESLRGIVDDIIKNIRDS
jgi:chromosomal replication initiator protein